MSEREARVIIDMMLDGITPFNKEKYWEAVHRVELDDKIDEYLTKHN